MMLMVMVISLGAIAIPVSAKPRDDWNVKNIPYAPSYLSYSDVVKVDYSARGYVAQANSISGNVVFAPTYHGHSIIMLSPNNRRQLVDKMYCYLNVFVRYGNVSAAGFYEIW